MHACYRSSRVYDTSQAAANLIIGVLDKLGYNKDLAAKRVEVFRIASDRGTYLYQRKSGENVKLIISGSRGEGLGVYFDADLDKVLVQNSVICYDSMQSDGGDYFAQFELDSEDSPCGYTRLRLTQLNQNFDEGETFKRNLIEALETRNGQRYLKNDKLLTKAFSRETIWNTEGWLTRKINFSKIKKGPSKPYKVHIPYSKINICVDDVIAFSCHCSEIVNRWVSRNRPSNWPTSELIAIVKQHKAFVVPVGIKKHSDENLQWRICLTLAETELVQSFNDTQIKVYAALKLLFKYELRPISSKMSSYIAKNVMFWLCENKGCDAFEKEMFEVRFVDGLSILLSFLENRRLPNYMISERNMIDQLSETKIAKLVDCTLKLRQGGINVLFKCPDVTTILQSSEQEVQTIIYRRELREQIITSIFTLGREECLAAVKEMFEAKTQKDVLHAFKRNAFEPKRRSDPLNFFNHIREEPDDDKLVQEFFKDITKSVMCRMFTCCL